MLVLKTRKELFAEAVARFLAAQKEISWFGGNSVARALLWTCAGLGQQAYQLASGLYRRYTVLAARGDALVDVAVERGVGKKLPATHATTYVVFQPVATTVTAITAAGPNDLIEVKASTGFAVGNSIRIRNGDGTETETATIAAITIGTGPGGGDEFQVIALAGTYSPGVEDVALLLRATIAAGSTLTTTVGVTFQTLDAVITGDANPIMDGESTSLALADKAWAECTTAGASGNVEAGAINALQTPVTGILAVFNPGRGQGGMDEETDLELKERAVHGRGGYAQETGDWAEQMLRGASPQVLRGVIRSDRAPAQLNLGVVKRNGGSFSATELAGMATWVGARVRSQCVVDVDNVTLTAIEVEARIRLLPDYTLRAVWKEASDKLAEYLDYRKWKGGVAVDEAALIAIVIRTPGIAALESSSFVPSADVEVADESFPTLARLSLEDIDTGLTINAELATAF